MARTHQTSRSAPAPPWRALYDRAAWAEIGPALATTVVPFALIVYLALRGGGYDVVVRSEVGVAVWWIVLLGALAGLLPLARLNRVSLAALGVLAAFGLWTTAALLWTESSERTVIEIARVGTYAGVFCLALCVQGRDSLRRTVGAVAAACALVGLLALLSRLHPPWFPENRTADVLPSVQARLNYPLNYWNGLSYLIAIGVPLLLAIATESRRILTQAVTTAAIPALVLAAFYTISRGGSGALLIAIGLVVALYPRRLAMLPTLALAGLGALIMIAAATQRDALEDGLSTAAAASQGHEMIAIVLVVAAGVGLLRAAVGLVERYEVGPRLRPSPRAARWAVIGVAAALVLGAVATGVPDRASNAWDEFKTPGGPEGGNTTARFESAAGNGRYQWWQAAVEAGKSEPLTGIGPGTYEFWWAREGSLPNFVRDAHSLYLEAWGELGIPGLLLVATFVFGAFGLGAHRALRGREPDRPWLAAATAGVGAFVVGSAFDWSWELAVLPVAFLCLTAAILQSLGGATEERAKRRIPARLALGAGAMALALAIMVPLASSRAIQSSQEAVDSEDLAVAQSRAETAADLQPWAATPPLQRALVLELRGDLGPAAAAATEATREEPTNWRTWWVLARIERARGDDAAANLAYARAQELNPRSPLFSQ